MQYMNKLVLFTVLYPGAEAYIDEFFESVKAQTHKDFDLLIVNDDCPIKGIKDMHPDLSIIELQGTGIISANRSVGINYVIEHTYDFLFLCDVDDYMKPERIEKSLDFLHGADIVVNDLDIVDAERRIVFKDYFKKSIDYNTILDKQFVVDKNIFGFSNTALRVSKLSTVEFPKDLRVVDWYYFTILINGGLKAIFIPESLTEYRQHSGNMIGISTYSVDMFKRLIALKAKHYSYFLNNKQYIDKYNDMLCLSDMSDSELNDLIVENSKKRPYPLWWQNVTLKN